MALPDIITVEDFFGPPEQSGASISPDGTRIAYLPPWKNRLNVWVQNLDSDADPRCVTADETRSVLSYEWTDDPRWLLYLQDSGGDENHHVYRVDLDEDRRDKSRAARIIPNEEHTVSIDSVLAGEYRNLQPKW